MLIGETAAWASACEPPPLTDRRGTVVILVTEERCSVIPRDTLGDTPGGRATEARPVLVPSGKTVGNIIVVPEKHKT